ncbi:hypothetical protein BDV97DRAFT_425643 [Delphinella strobiligena]|nr:hypothetical protein BDV97DRAFT_425643 [Delphinella strobiligena]
MPPKRAKTATKATSTRSAPKTRTTRTRASATEAVAENTAELESSNVSITAGAERTRNSNSGRTDVTSVSGGVGDSATRARRTRRLAPETDGANDGEERAVTPVQKTMPRGRTRPPRTVKKVMQSEANKAAMEAIKKRMEDDARRLKEGDAAVSTPTDKVEEAERNIAAVAEVPAAPGLPPANISPPAARTKPAPTTVQRKAPGTLQRAPNTVQRAAPGTAARPQSTLKMQSTPGIETSVLSLANFKRRARQPSLLQMVQNPELAQTLDDTTDFTLGRSDEEDDFAPYDESTPLHLSKAQHPQSATTQRSEIAPSATPSSAQRLRDDDIDSMYGASPLPSPKRTRKRKSDALDEPSNTEIQVPRSQPSPSIRNSPHSSPALPADSADYGDPETVPATAPLSDSPLSSLRQSQLSSTYADPLSSSPPASPVSPSAPTPRPAARQSTPSPRAARKSRKEAKPKPLTTATLRALLPKRGVKQPAIERSEFDITSSSIEQAPSASDDELAPRARAGNRGSTQRRGVLSSISKKKPLQPRKPAPKPKPKPPTTAPKKTYSKAITISSSDKENGSSSPLSTLLSGDPTTTPPDTSIEIIRGTITGTKTSPAVAARRAAGLSVGGEPRTKELKERKKYFEEVDEWEMEFESAPSLGGGLGSSPAWR